MDNWNATHPPKQRNRTSKYLNERSKEWEKENIGLVYENSYSVNAYPSLPL